MLFEVTETLPAEKLSFRVPVVPLIERSVKVATPLALVVAVTVPPSVPPPDEIAAVTTMPATGLLDASFARIAGWVGKATPLWTVPEGCVLILSGVAFPTQ